ncbi:unnamed protein product [Lathyrus sativus]|nr:unnamed protein product [Lathyrus sativus]
MGWQEQIPHKRKPKHKSVITLEDYKHREIMAVATWMFWMELGPEALWYKVTLGKEFSFRLMICVNFLTFELVINLEFCSFNLGFESWIDS